MQYHTIKEIKELVGDKRQIINVWQENNWIVAELDNSVRIKFLNF